MTSSSKPDIISNKSIVLSIDNVDRLLKIVADGLLRMCANNVYLFEHDDDGDKRNECSARSYPSGIILDGGVLCNILWRLRPVALDIACLISDCVMEDVSKSLDKGFVCGDGDRMESLRGSYGSVSQVALVLFSKWISISPHLEPIVSNLFAGKYNNQTSTHLNMNPFDYQLMTNIKSGEAKLSLVGSVHRLLHYYRHSCHGGSFILKRWWLWNMSGILELLGRKGGDDMADVNICYYSSYLLYHAAHVFSLYFDMQPSERNVFFTKLGIEIDEIPAFSSSIHYNTNDTCFNPCGENSCHDQFERSFIPLHVKLGNPGLGHIVTSKKFHDSVPDSHIVDDGLILTETTRRNLLKISTAIFASRSSVLVCGPHGSGKSALVRELARITGQGDGLLELHLDDQTDSKSLLGTYVATDTPGKFEWKPGALTHAVRTGRWVLMEDVDTVPKEVLAALVPLIEKHLISLDKDGVKDHAHPDFRFLATCTTLPFIRDDTNISDKKQYKGLSGGNRTLLTPTLWQKVFIDPLPTDELKEITKSLHPSLPDIVLTSCLDTFRSLDVSRRDQEIAPLRDDEEKEVDKHVLLCRQSRFDLERKLSVRDYMKVCKRINKNVPLESSLNFLTETQRALCLAEAVDIFAAASPSKTSRKFFVMYMAAPIWGLTADFAYRYVETRKPSVDVDESRVKVGRVYIEKPSLCTSTLSSQKRSNFTDTSYSLRLMESIAVSISQNEPLLLVGRLFWEIYCQYYEFLLSAFTFALL